MSETPVGPDTGGRVVILDTLRGVSILLMVIYHFGYDLMIYCGLPYYVLRNPLLDTLQTLFAGLFILLSGISCRYSGNNLRRGLQLLAAAFAVTGVTALTDYLGITRGAIVTFGIIHFMGAAALIFWVLQRVLDRLPGPLLPILCAAGILATWAFLPARVDFGGFFWLGLKGPGFHSADYFPLLPWIFVYLFGTWLGVFIRAGRFPPWFYRAKEPFFSACGRRTLIIYLLHQPALMGLTLLIRQIQDVLSSH
ncbi:DUF1624 domain-containing protein [Oscillospiraceae bacterium OttesenSCG-928-F05]|nr:DUF1624 domain-containing protein [Oscillospiraceae bacterium OttesenSCG-928-F05]